MLKRTLIANCTTSRSARINHGNMPNHFGMCSVGVLRTRGVWMPSPPDRRFNVVRSRISASAHSALHTCGDPPLKGVALLSHCANATRPVFVALAGRQMVSSAGSGPESINCISVTHGSTGRLMPGGKAATATHIEPQDRRNIGGSTQCLQATVRRF